MFDQFWRPTTWISLPPAIVLIVAASLVAMSSASLWIRWIRAFPVFALELLLLGLVITGMIGHDYGLSGLFWHEDRGVQFTAGVSLGTLALLLFFLSFVRGDETVLADRAARS